MVVVAIGAHPDDETMFAGGLLAKYASEGHEVYILLTTRGEGGELGEPPLCTREELGALREREAMAAAAALGAEHVFFLPFVDPPVGPDNTLHAVNVGEREFSNALAIVISSLEADIVVTHGSNGEYGHPHHVMTHRGVLRALEFLKPWQPKELLTWCAAYPDPEQERFINKDDPADLVLDITPWRAQKVAAAHAYLSQHPVFLHNNPGKLLADIPLHTESYRRIVLGPAA